jgi:hypothetical protein
MIGKAMISSRVIAAAIGVLLASPLTTTQATTVHRAAIEDYRDILTPKDAGFTDLSGNMGIVNKDGKPLGVSTNRLFQQMRSGSGQL